MRYLLTILCFIALQAHSQALFHAHNKVSATPPPPGGCGGDGIAVSTVVSAYKARLATAGYSMTSGEEGAWTTFIQTLSDSCIYDEVEELFAPFMGAASAPAALGFKGVADLTAVGTITYNSNGAQLNGSSYFETNLLATVTGQTSAHIGAYITSGGTSWRWSYGALAGSWGLYHLSGGGNFDYTKLNSTAQNMPGHTYTTGVVFHSRTGEDTVRRRYNATEFVERTTMSSSPPQAYEVYLGALNEGGTANYKSDARYAFFTIGRGLSPQQVITYTNAINTLFTYYGINTY